MGKKTILLILTFSIILLLPIFVSAKLEVKKQIITDTIIKEINNPAIFTLDIKNPGNADTFTIYSLAGVKVVPNNSFFLNTGYTKSITIQLYPEDYIINKEEFYPFVLKIKGEETGLTEEILSLRIFKLGRSFTVGADNIYLDDTNARVFVKNNGDYAFPEIKAHFTSDFFDFERTFALASDGEKEFIIPIDKNKMKTLEAGQYVIKADVEVAGIKDTSQGVVSFAEKSILQTKESKEGIFIRKYTVDKINGGNIPIKTEIRINKNIISRLFTNFNVEPSSVERQGVTVTYIFSDEVSPGKTFEVVATTNYIYPLIVIILLLILLRVLYVYTSSQVTIRKRVRFVKTKTGEFALQVSLFVRANKFVERISVLDKYPYSVKLYKEFTGSSTPKKVDEPNRRLEWSIDGLNAGEERVFNYIIYSKIAPLGKFELPQSSVIYEREGRIKEAFSNRAFFINEIRSTEL